MEQQSVSRAAAWMGGWLTATLALTIAGRELARDVSVFELMLLRSLIATAILTPFVLLNGGLAGRFTQLPLHLVRNLIHYGAQYAWFTALLLIPLAEVIAIEFTLPVWIAILATLFLAERMNWAKSVTVALGFAGVLLIVKPTAGSLHPGHVVALMAALGFACTMTLTKYITRRDSALTVIFLMFASQIVIGLVPGLYTWTWPQPHNWIWVAVIGVTGTFSHYCLARAISLAGLTIVSPLDFLRLPLTGILGWLLYQEAIDIYSVAGAVLILAANTLNLVKARTP